VKTWTPLENSEATGDPYKTLFVGRLSFDTSEHKLKREFEMYGQIKKVRIIQDKNGKPRGYAFVEFEREKDMRNAYKLADGRKIDNRRILVDVERGRTVRNWRPRRLGGGIGTARGGTDSLSKYTGQREPSGSKMMDERSGSKEREREKESGTRDRERSDRTDRGERSDRDRSDRDRSDRGDRDKDRERSDRDGHKHRSRSRERDRGSSSRGEKRHRERSRERPDKERERDKSSRDVEREREREQH